MRQSWILWEPLAMRWPLLLFGLWLLAATSASAATFTLNCTYPTYSDQEGSHATEPPFTLTFLVDTDTGTAYLIGNLGSDTVRLIKSAESDLTLVEVTPSGYVQVTAIAASGESVHSRQAKVLGKLDASQYYGTCKRKE
jgi:hypothetical protein